RTSVCGQRAEGHDRRSNPGDRLLLRSEVREVLLEREAAGHPGHQRDDRAEPIAPLRPNLTTKAQANHKRRMPPPTIKMTTAVSWETLIRMAANTELEAIIACQHTSNGASHSPRAR